MELPVTAIFKESNVFEVFLTGFKWAADWCVWLSGAFCGWMTFMLIISLFCGVVGGILLLAGIVPKKGAESNGNAPTTDKVEPKQ